MNMFLDMLGTLWKITTANTINYKFIPKSIYVPMKRFTWGGGTGGQGELGHAGQDQTEMGHVSHAKDKTLTWTLGWHPGPQWPAATWSVVPRDPPSTAYT